MPRLARLDTPGILHHVIIRGIERKEIFRDKADKENFIDRFAQLIPETRTRCYAWVLMTNHAHFLFRSGPCGLAVLMRRLLTGYAVSFNHRHRRHGQLFQNRYKSIICQEDAYLKELVRYIHLNPLRADMVNDFRALNSYAFSGHRLLAGKGECGWQDAAYVLGCFDESAATARERYLAYVKAGISMGRRPELVGGGLIRSVGGWAEVKKIRLKGMDRIKGDERILGDSDFVMSVLSSAKEQFERGYELKRLGYDVDRVAEKVAVIYEIEPDEIFQKGRQKIRANARGLFCYWCSSQLGISLTELAGKLEMTVSGAGYAAKRGEALAKRYNYSLTN
ncbi:MAG: transposase [Desulfobacterales bacterium]|nr:transposase [Desulfobacterales bacterium]MDD4072507.1 transposase [Desulfobacterales bacterium]MDD4393716.1 transposase [Desulfobacterales bacterium]